MAEPCDDLQRSLHVWASVHWCATRALYATPKPTLYNQDRTACTGTEHDLKHVVYSITEYDYNPTDRKHESHSLAMQVVSSCVVKPDKIVA